MDDAGCESHETEPVDVDISDWPAQFVNIPIEDLMYKNMSPSMESVVRRENQSRVKLYDGGLSSIRWKLHISLKSSFLRYAVFTVLSSGHRHRALL